jgi:hypothetical protein
MKNRRREDGQNVKRQRDEVRKKERNKRKGQKGKE